MASIRERIYSNPPGAGPSIAGVLIYTAAPDSEATFGGLVTVGKTRELERQLDAALEGLELCASDPLYAESTPTEQFLALHGAACLACVFAPETLCEPGNRYLDRSVLVETVERQGFAFFRGEMMDAGMRRLIDEAVERILASWWGRVPESARRAIDSEGRRVTPGG